jgi:hypothetical protein
MAYKLPIGFFAYPSSPPMLPETVRAAVEKINKTKQVHITTWEEARVGGKGIINEILKAIDASDFVVADLTGLNLNVLFEVGYSSVDTSKPATSGRVKTGHQGWRPRLVEIYFAASS